MNWALYAIAGLVTTGALTSVTLVGKERKPSTPGVVAVLLAVDAAIVVVLVVAAMRLS